MYEAFSYRFCVFPTNNSVQGSVLAVGTRRGFVHIFDANACARVRRMSGHTHRVGSLSWSGNVLASGSKDRSIRLRDTRLPEGTFQELNGHKFVIRIILPGATHRVLSSNQARGVWFEVQWSPILLACQRRKRQQALCLGRSKIAQR